MGFQHHWLRDWFMAGFSPRKDSFTLYLCGGFESHADLMSKLGKYKTGVGCLYVKKLEDVDEKVLKQLVIRTLETKPGAPTT